MKISTLTAFAKGVAQQISDMENERNHLRTKCTQLETSIARVKKEADNTVESWRQRCMTFEDQVSLLTIQTSELEKKLNKQERLMGDVPELILDRERLEFVMLHIIPNTFVGNSLSQRLEVSISLEYGERTVEFRGLTMREALDAARMFISNQQEGKEES